MAYRRRTRLALVLVSLAPWYFSILLFNSYLPSAITSYAEDVLCMPFVLSLAALLLDFIFPGKGQLQLGQVVFACFYTTIIFEVLLPRWSPRYTADIWDACCYFAGAILWWLWIKPKTIRHGTP